MWDPISIGVERNILYNGVETSLRRRVLKTLKRTLKRKVEGRQYLVTVGLSRYIKRSLEQEFLEQVNLTPL